MKTLIKSVFVLFFAILFSSSAYSAQYKEINGRIVKNIILNDKIFKIYQFYVPLSASGFKEGIKQKMWNRKGRVSINGINEFQNIDFYKIGMPSVILRNRLGVKIKITGMYDTDFRRHLKVVDFTFRYTGVSSTAKRFISRGGSGSVSFIKYDKGFNFYRIRIKPLKQPFKLTNAELASQNNYIKKLNKDKLKQKVFVENLLKTSKRKGKIKKSFEETYSRGSGSNKLIYSDVISVYNNYINIKRNLKQYNNYPNGLYAESDREYNIWIGAIKKIESKERRYFKTNKKYYTIIVTYDNYTWVMITFEDGGQYREFSRLFSEAQKKWNRKYKLLKFAKK